MTKRACVFGLFTFGLIVWLWPSTQTDRQRATAQRTAPSPTPEPPSRHSVPARSTASQTQAEETPRQAPARTRQIRIALSTDTRLQHSIVNTGPSDFAPASFVTFLDPDSLPDTQTGDAVASWLSPQHTIHDEASDTLVDAVLDDPDLEDFDQDWIDIIDLETERLLEQEDFKGLKGAIIEADETSARVERKRCPKECNLRSARSDMLLQELSSPSCGVAHGRA